MTAAVTALGRPIGSHTFCLVSLRSLAWLSVRGQEEMDSLPFAFARWEYPSTGMCFAGIGETAFFVANRHNSVAGLHRWLDHAAAGGVVA